MSDQLTELLTTDEVKAAYNEVLASNGLAPLAAGGRNDGLTDAEGEAADALAAAARAFGRLPVQHPDETREFIDAIHAAQNVLAIRIARRHYPRGWPTYEQADEQLVGDWQDRLHDDRRIT